MLVHQIKSNQTQIYIAPYIRGAGAGTRPDWLR